MPTVFPAWPTTNSTQHGKPRFVVLFSDMLLVLKVKKQGKSHHMEWFADQEYSMKTVSDHRHYMAIIYILK